MLETYIVRIYRRDEKDSGHVVGMVERVGIKNHQTFRNLDELIQILSNRRNSPPTSSSGRKKRGD